MLVLYNVCFRLFLLFDAQWFQSLALSIVILFYLCFVFYLNLIIPFRILIISKHVFDYRSLKESHAGATRRVSLVLCQKHN